MATKTTITYEIGSCSRCGGSGHYSYCQRYGTTCFKCAGSGKSITRKGASARAKIEEFIVANFTIAVADVKVGDLIRVSSSRVRVTAIEPGGCSDPTGIPWITFTLKHRPPVIDTGWCVRSDQTVIRMPAGADWLRVVELARKLKGATITESEVTK
jgi:hypothetical protein